MLKSKQDIIKQFGQASKDTGSPEVQVALLSNRIDYLTEHFKKHENDNHGRRGLLKMVSKRRSLLEYLKGVDISRYSKLIETLDLRK